MKLFSETKGKMSSYYCGYFCAFTVAATSLPFNSEIKKGDGSQAVQPGCLCCLGDRNQAISYSHEAQLDFGAFNIALTQ